MRGNRDQALDLLEELQENGVSAQSILNFILTHSLSGDYALYAMRDAKAEFLDDEDEDEDEDQNLEVGMEVEVVDEDCSQCVLEYQDVGTITEIDEENGIRYFRVEVDGRSKAGNWMRASQLARINY